ncbi:MAG: hypothetical protein KGZ54_11890 [Dethiobacter sp.]|nr:hypothetical protein [Dethiobacter sp.]MBS3902699.1 hypothetical protein [Dethiobacter sp.]MBS3989728.1 hypothetical protein [Dethiobacter sp.]
MTHLPPATWRKLVQKEIGKVPDVVWNLVVEKGYIDTANNEALNCSDEEALEGLIADVENELTSYAAYHASGPRLPKLQPNQVKELQVKDIPPDAHCAALTKIFSGMVNRDADVRQFRSDILGGKLLSGSEAADWFQSQAKKEPPTETISLDITAGEGWEDRFLTEAKRYVEARKAGKDCPHERTFAYLITIPLAIYANHVNKKGVLARLQEVSQKISGYGFWTEGQASYFILTGIGHPISPITQPRVIYGASPFNRIVLEVLPHVPGSMVERLYRGARTSAAKAFGQKEKHRQLTEKHLALAVLAAETPPPWPRRLRKWNKVHPEWAYPASARATFARDCRVAYERLTGWKWAE